MENTGAVSISKFFEVEAAMSHELLDGVIRYYHPDETYTDISIDEIKKNWNKIIEGVDLDILDSWDLEKK